MSIGICIIALVVVIVGAAIIYGRALAKQGRERKAIHLRRREDYDREEMFKSNAEAWQRGEPPTDDDSTKTLPILPGQEP